VTVEPHCDGCRFFRPDPWACNTAPVDADPDGTYGECRRRPPRIIESLALQVVADSRKEFPQGWAATDAAIDSTMFPYVAQEDWCGEWQPRSDAKPVADESRWMDFLASLSVRAHNILDGEGIGSFGHLDRLPDRFLRGLRNLGQATLNEIRERRKLFP
jgi:hypothetical protein